MISHVHDPHVGDWEELCAVMDSGAADSVAPCAIAEEVPMLESPGSRNGQQYLTADGTKLPNKGQKSFTAMTSEGRSIGVTYQMADVSRPLNSVGRICDRDNAVVFTKTTGFILNLWTQEKTRFSREEGVYALRTWIPKSARSAARASPDFARQG